jgi:hypothetical protein
VHHHTIKQINQSDASVSDLLLIVQIQLNMFRTSSCPSSGAYKLQQQPPVYRWNVVVTVLLVVVGPDDYDQRHRYHHVPTVNQWLLLLLLQFRSS